MIKNYFTFCHAIYQHDPRVISLSHETAYRLTKDAFDHYEAVKPENSVPSVWVAQNYDAWLKRYIPVSERMPEEMRAKLLR